MECLGGLCYRVRLVVHVLLPILAALRFGRLGGRCKLACRLIVLSQNFLRFLTIASTVASIDALGQVELRHAAVIL